MKINVFLFFVFIAVLLGLGYFFIQERGLGSAKLAKQFPLPQTNYEYYWTPSCTECDEVTAFLDSWSGKDKVVIQSLKLLDDKDAALKFLQRGAFCKIQQSNLDVPLLVKPGGSCITGSQNIIDYLKRL